MAMLNSLVIKNFRMLEDFTVEKLGRVNLIVGKNNSGKSTILEALRIYAGNANLPLLKSIAESHDEKWRLNLDDIGRNNISLPFEDFFSARQAQLHKEISIGQSYRESLFIRAIQYTRTIIYSKHSKERESSPKQLRGLEISKPGLNVTISFEDNYTDSYPSNSSQSSFVRVKEAFIPTQFISIDELANEWDDIVYTENEKIVIDALKIILPEFEHLVFVQNEGSTSNRIAKVKLANLPRPVPLKSLGDGMLRILQIAIKLVSAQGGFLLIDEFENGLHYSVQEKVWTLLFEMAEKLDVQIFATTHSWDCIQSFNAVALQKENSDAVLIHMGRSARKSNYGQVIASVYDKNELQSMTQAEIEVR